MDEMKGSKKAEEVKEGMQPEKEDEGDGHHENAEEVEYEEHVWLSLNAIKPASLSSSQLLRRM